ncbi:hypothetical protein E1B28_008449 [Marasmius oreades]|uniref:Uncharacterized protein n=1 Tax=Marasmius oreades TaxID=181124 RepID=A0A9P7S003_9AGAR|nr:uncharacterized protein E1B28_008449 [Marasmius oreades]KAG7092068.1 hypothetical protein E1B28_008449 [Marasmius oreades]
MLRLDPETDTEQHPGTKSVLLQEASLDVTIFGSAKAAHEFEKHPQRIAYFVEHGVVQVADQ